MNDLNDTPILEYASREKSRGILDLPVYDRRGLYAFLGVLGVCYFLGLTFSWLFTNISFPIAGYVRRYVRHRFNAPNSIETGKGERWFIPAMWLVMIFVLFINSEARRASCRHGWSFGSYGFGITHTSTIGPCGLVVKQYWRIADGWYIWRE